MNQVVDWVWGNKNEKKPYCLASKNSNSSDKGKHLKIQINEWYKENIWKNSLIFMKGKLTCKYNSFIQCD